MPAREPAGVRRGARSAPACGVRRAEGAREPGRAGRRGRGPAAGVWVDAGAPRARGEGNKKGDKRTPNRLLRRSERCCTGSGKKTKIR